MTLNELKQVIEWTQEGKLQFRKNGETWVDYNNMEQASKNGISYDISLNDSIRFYRQRPASTLRPWKLEEVIPLIGKALIRDKRFAGMAIVTGISNTGRIVCGTDNEHHPEWDYGFTCEFCFLNCEHSTDNGISWKPCGVEE